MEEVVYAPNQVIFSQHSNYEDSIFLILKGEVTLSVERKPNNNQQIHQQPLQYILNKEKVENNLNLQLKKKIQILKDGDSFGLYSFITGQDKIMNAQSNKFSQIIKINRSSFLNIIKNNKADYEKFTEFKDKVLFERNYRVLKYFNCYGCKSYEHTFENCNKTFFDKQNVYIFHHYNYCPFQERNSQYIRKKIQFNSIQCINKIQENAKKYVQDNNLIQSNHDLSIDSPFQGYQQSDDEDDDDDQTNTEQNISIKDQLSPIQEEKYRTIKKKKFSLNPLKSIDVTSIMSENMEETKKYIDEFTMFNNANKIKQIEKQSTIEYAGDEEINNSSRLKTKSQYNTNHASNFKKGSAKRITSDLDTIGLPSSPKAVVESVKREFNFSANLENLAEKLKVSSLKNLEKERSPQSPQASHFYEALPPIPQRKSILINDKDEIVNNQGQLIKSLALQSNHHIQKPRLSMHFLNSQFLRKFYNQQHQQTKDDFQMDDYFDWKFEKIQEYQYYFINYNYQNVIKRFNGAINNRINKKKKTQRLKSRTKGQTIVMKTQKQIGISTSYDKQIPSNIRSNTSNILQGFDDKPIKSSQMINDMQ